jgi:hypothetical protein
MALLALKVTSAVSVAGVAQPGTVQVKSASVTVTGHVALTFGGTLAQLGQPNTFTAPQAWQNLTAVNFSAGGTPKFPVPAHTNLLSFDTFGGLHFGGNYLVSNWNPGTFQNVIPDFALFASVPGRPFAHSMSLNEMGDPPDVTMTQWGPSGCNNYGGGSAVATAAVAASISVTLINTANSQALGCFLAGQLVMGDNVNSVIPAATTILSLNGGPVASTSGGGSQLTLTLSNPIAASAGSGIHSIARPGDLTSVGAGSLMGQAKVVPAFAPYAAGAGTPTTPGALAITQSASMNFRSAEAPRDGTGHQNLLLGTDIWFYTTQIGRASSDHVATISAGGNLLLGASASTNGDNGDFIQVWGAAGTNTAHQIKATAGTVGTLSAPLNPGGGAITTLPIGGTGVLVAQQSGASITTTVVVGAMTLAKQTWVLNAPAAVGDPTIIVVSQSPNYAYPSGQIVQGNTIASGTFTLTFFPDAPSNGYATPAVSAGIGSIVGGLWQATSADVAAALAAITAASAVMQCSFGTAALALKFLAPNGQIPSVGATVAGTAIGRADAGCVTTNTSTTVTDAAITAPDAGRSLVGTGVQGGTTIVSVTPGVSFVMSLPATASGTATMFIGIPATVVAGRADAGCVTNSTTLVTDASAIAADVNKTVTGANIPQGTTIVSVSAGVSFVMSNAASTSTTLTLTIGAPTVAGFTISAATSNNSNGASITISGFTLGLDSTAVAVTGGPLPGAAITVTFQGTYYGNHFWQPMWVTSSLVGGTLSCSAATIGQPSDATQRGFYHRRGSATQTADYFTFQNSAGTNQLNMTAAGLVNAPGGITTATPATNDNSTSAATTAFVVNYVTANPPPSTADLERNAKRPAAALADTFPRDEMISNAITLIGSGFLTFTPIYLTAGQIVTNITFFSGATALATGTNQWFCLYSKARAKLGVTSDDTSTAWATNVPKTLALSAPYTAPTSDVYLLGIMVNATTPPSLSGKLTLNTAFVPAPVLNGTSTSALTNPASAPGTAAALTARTGTPYAYVS